MLKFENWSNLFLEKAGYNEYLGKICVESFKKEMLEERHRWNIILEEKWTTF